MVTSRRILVVTVVHHPDDARIRARQIEALLAAGWAITYAAPWTGYRLEPPATREGLTLVDLPRAVGRSRLDAFRAARRLIRTEGPHHDLVLLHDPELLPAAAGVRGATVVWDVHEDAAAAMRTKEWLPGPLQRAAALAVRAVERVVERRIPLLLADDRYNDRFRRTHPVVRNSTWVPSTCPPTVVPDPDGSYRVVYLGSLTLERGAAELVAVARGLASDEEGSPPVRLEVIGAAHGRTAELLTTASDEGLLTWSGYLPNAQALARIEGALAGLSLLHDLPNFTPSLPTKVGEYLARGVPVVTTPLPVAVDLVERSGGGLVVPFGAAGVDPAIRQIRAWAAEPTAAADVGRRGHAFARQHLDWGAQSSDFVATLAEIADAQRSPRRASTSE